MVLAACGGRPAPAADAPVGPDALRGPDAALGACTAAAAAKLAFTQATGCSNDGSVEFCAPDGDAGVAAALAAISPTITCAPGGGRARCLDAPGQLLCFYPTAVPDQCVAQHGALTDAAWADVCAIAALPAITAIVATFYE